MMLSGKADISLIERIRVQASDAVAPILDAISRPVATVTEIADQLEELSQIQAENTRLKKDRAQLLQWQTVARQLEAENKALRGLLKFSPPPKATYITSRVIANAVGAFAHSLLLNVGAPDGVKKDQAVTTGKGLIGRIASVGNRSSWVLLITDLNSRIPVVIESTRTRAIMAGNNSDRPRLIHLSPGAMVSPGERIITSGHGGVFPPGLAIGTVSSVSDSGIEIQPFNDRRRVEYVRILDFGDESLIRPAPFSSSPSSARPSSGRPSSARKDGKKTP